MTLAPIRQFDLTIHGKESSVSTGLLANSVVTNAKLENGAIDNVKIAADAAIAYSKLSLAGTIVNADIASAAAIAYSKLSLGNSIVDADINSAAAIAWSKLDKTGSSIADLTTRSASDIDSGTLADARLTANVPLKDAASNAFTGDMSVDGSMTIGGNLVVNGTTTTVNSTEVTVEDRIMQLNYNSGANAPAPADFSGFAVNRGAINSVSRDKAALVWDETNSVWKFAMMSNDSTVASLQKVIMDDLEAADIVAASLDLSGGFSMGGNLQVDGTINVDGAATLGSTLGVTGNFAINTDKFTVAAASGNTAIAGTLDVVGAVGFDAALDVVGAVVMHDTLNVMGAVDLDSTLNVDGAVDFNLTLDVDGAVNFASTLDVVGAVTAASFAGDGALLTNLDADNIASGELSDARLSPNVMLLDNNQTVTGIKTFNSSLTSVMAANTDAALKAKVSGDSVDRFFLQADGKMLFGNGSAAADAILYRAGVGILKTDTDFQVGGDLAVTGDASVANLTAVDGGFSGNLSVDGNITGLGTGAFTGNLSSMADISAGGNLDITGTADIMGNFAINTDKFTVAASSGNTVIAGSLNAGAISATSLSTSQNVTVGGNLVVNGTVTYVNSTNTAVKDKLIHLNEAETQGANDSVPAGYAGISINRGTASSVERDHAAFVWDEANSRFKAGMLTSDDVTLTLGDLQVDDLYAAYLRGDGSNITGMSADQMAVTPAGNLGSTDVQAALEELQGAIDTLSGSSSSSLGDLGNEVDAIEADLGFNANGSMNAFTGTNYIDAMTVRAAIVQLDTETKGVADDLAAHIADSVDAHDASAISVVPTGNLASSDVQAALEEHQADIDALQAKQWRQALIYSASGGEVELAKPNGAPAIPAGAATQVFIDGRKVFEGANRQYQVANDGAKITFAALDADQSVELLYWA